eukprot:364409-Chlamydomonas_euryale.AAC.11
MVARCAPEQALLPPLAPPCGAELGTRFQPCSCEVPLPWTLGMLMLPCASKLALVFPAGAASARQSGRVCGRDVQL